MVHSELDDLDLDRCSPSSEGLRIETPAPIDGAAGNQALQPLFGGAED